MKYKCLFFLSILRIFWRGSQHRQRILLSWIFTLRKNLQKEIYYLYVVIISSICFLFLWVKDYQKCNLLISTFYQHANRQKLRNHQEEIHDTRVCYGQFYTQNNCVNRRTRMWSPLQPVLAKLSRGDLELQAMESTRWNNIIRLI